METVFYTFCAYLPIHLLAYLPFLDILRFGKLWMALTVAFNLAVHLLGVAWMVALGRPDLVLLVGLAVIPLSLALYFLNIRLSPGKLLFTYMLLVNYQIIATGVAAFLAARLMHVSARSWECGLICLLLFILAWKPMYRLFRYAAGQVYRMDAPRLWRVIWLLPAVMAGMVSVLSGGLQDQMVQSWQFLFARIALLFCVVLVYWVLVNSLEEIRKQTILQEQLNFETHLMELQMDEQQKHNRLMMEHEEQLRRQRHDLRHQLAVIRQLADTDPARLKEYVASLLEAIPVAVWNFRSGWRGCLTESCASSLAICWKMPWKPAAGWPRAQSSSIWTARCEAACSPSPWTTASTAGSPGRTAPTAPASAAIWGWGLPPYRPWPKSTGATHALSRTGRYSAPPFTSRYKQAGPLSSTNFDEQPGIFRTGTLRILSLQ